jgi:Subtilase family
MTSPVGAMHVPWQDRFVHEQGEPKIMSMEPDGYWTPGHPFGDDYPDPRSAGQLAGDQRAVRRQLANLDLRAQDESVRRELVNQIKRRRSLRDDLVQFEEIPSRRGYDMLVSRGELLVRREHADNPNVEGFLEPYGFFRTIVEELDGRVVRFRHDEIDPRRLNDIARFLRRRGIQASLNHVAPLGPVGKALSGPEPSAGSREFSPMPETLQVAVIDNGITAEQRADGWLQDQDAPRTGDNVDPVNDIAPPFLDFAAGHGTSVSGVIQQVDTGVGIRMYRELDGDGFSDELGVAAGMVRAVRDGARVLNLSFGTQTLDDQLPIGMQAAIEIIEEEHGDEVVLVAAAGNFGDTRPCYPAAFPQVVAVAGLTADGLPSSWSSRGFWVTCSAVAEGILTPYVEGQESWLVDWQPDTFPANSWALWSGTSFAAPQVVGAIARICQEDGVAPREALRRLLRRGRVIPDFGRALEILPGT